MNENLQLSLAGERGANGDGSGVGVAEAVKLAV
jgi:hypothetical protein